MAGRPKRRARLARGARRARSARCNPAVTVTNLIKHVPAEVQQAASRLRGGQAGVRTNLVGGAVIDLLQGRTPKDWDIEVFGLSPNQLASKAKQMGRADEVGKAFGIVKLVLPSGLDLDLSVPRRDNKIGTGHKGFEVAFDPRMSNREAARRRDFTINSMAVDLKTGKLIDPFNGLADLRAGVLKATDPKLFVEDPLRALRAMQLLARKAKTVHPSTLRLIKGMKSSFKDLPPERVLVEWQKLLLKADKPSVGLEFLRESEWIEHFPELDVLHGVEQNVEWHPEGDVWVHTKQMADAAAQKRAFVPEHQREAFVFGSMLHDVGKASTTVTQDQIDAGLFPQERLLTSYGHDAVGRPLARQFMKRLKASKRTTGLTEELVGAHMKPYGLLAGNAGRKAYARLARQLHAAGGDIPLLAAVSQCDACATGQGRHFHRGDPNWEHEVSENLFRWAEDVETPEAQARMIQGRDLIALGHSPGPQFGQILGFAQDLQDQGHTRLEIILQVEQTYPVPR